jgi:hypothetical protein
MEKRKSKLWILLTSQKNDNNIKNPISENSTLWVKVSLSLQSSLVHILNALIA